MDLLESFKGFEGGDGDMIMKMLQGLGDDQ